MFEPPPSLKRGYVDDDRLYQFVNLDGVLEVFDIEEALKVKANGDDGVWYGRNAAGRADQVLYHIAESRWVMVFVTFPGDEHHAIPDPVNRELLPRYATRWLRLNKHALPRELKTVIAKEADEHQPSENRLDRAWVLPVRREGPEIDVPTCRHSSVPSGRTAVLEAPPAIEASSRNPLKRGDLEHFAIALLLKHPDWSNKRIAEELNCHPKSLSRCEKFCQARRVIKSSRNELPRGRKDGETRSIEAWDDE